MRLFLTTIALAVCCGCATAPSAHRATVSGALPDDRAPVAALPPPKPSFFSRFRLSRLWEPDEKPRDATIVPRTATRPAPPVALSPPEESVLVLPSPTEGRASATPGVD